MEEIPENLLEYIVKYRQATYEICFEVEVNILQFLSLLQPR